MKVLTVNVRTPYDGGRLTTESIMTLTPHQRTTLNYIREFQRKRGYSPSLSDLAVAFGVRSKNAVAKVVTALVKSGHLEKDPKGRIKIIEMETESQPLLSLPLMGPISAGFAAPVEEHATEHLRLEDYLVQNRASTFLLRVRGDSMIDAGIHEGDIVIVERGRTPKLHDIVVGILDGEYTLKILQQHKGKYYLQAQNSAYPDLYPMDELQVAGVVRGVVRRY